MPLAGKRFETLTATYIVNRVLGEGGAGRVFDVMDEQGSSFALKSLKADRVPRDKLKRFRNEIAFCKRAIHPGIVPVVDDGFVIEGDIKVPFYVMPRLAGTLREWIGGRLQPSEALNVFSRILDAVEAAHLSKVWHRDLKPENVLLGDTTAELFVADFGIAHFGEDALHTAVETRDDARLANFAYAAPEQRQRGTRVDHRADIFALGLMLNELFTGEVPHGKSHKTVGSVAEKFGYLDSIVDEMLAQSPDARPASISAVKSSLAQRGLLVVAQQKVSELHGAVVPATTPEPVEEIEFAAFDYRRGRLIITLNRQPAAGWFGFFRDPPNGHTSVVGYGPHQFELDGRTLSIPVPEKLVEAVLMHAREYARKATLGLSRERADQATKAEAREREALRAQIAEEEARARILARLSKIGPG